MKVWIQPLDITAARHLARELEALLRVEELDNVMKAVRTDVSFV
jgi:hypothetical protein